MELEVVIHADYGGFHIDDEMALWLMENRGWTLIPEKEFDYKQKKTMPLTTLVDLSLRDGTYAPHQDEIEFRSHPDLIACVRAIQKAHENDEYPDSYYGYIHGLRIKKIKVHLDVEDYHDGKEKISCWISEEDED